MIRAKFILIFVFIFLGLFVIGQDTLLIESNSKFSLQISTYNHAHRSFDGTMTYNITNDTLKIYKTFETYHLPFSKNEQMSVSYKDTVLLFKKIERNSINRIKNIQLDYLDDFYFNYCVIATSGNEYFIMKTIDNEIKKISIHHYYEKQIEKLITELNIIVPDNLKLEYMPEGTVQDCKM